MFWTLEPCMGCHHMSIFEEPLIIWLQGGPGASGAGYGNFMVSA
jgi:carboxypeptidase C (cathepsin A)